MTATFVETTKDEWQRFSDVSKSDQSKAKNGELRTLKKTYFKLGTVFDISQTNCPAEDYPKIYSMGYSSEQHNQLYNNLKEICRDKYGCEVKEENLNSISVRGEAYSKKNVIRINDKLKDTQKLSTLSHELGHFLMHHGDSAKGKPESLVEVEADMFSIMLQTHCGIEIEDTRKRHLATQYQKYCTELRSQNKSPQIEEIFSSVSDVFKQSVDTFHRQWERHRFRNQRLLIQGQETDRIFHKGIDNTQNMEYYINRKSFN